MNIIVYPYTLLMIHFVNICSSYGRIYLSNHNNNVQLLWVIILKISTLPVRIMYSVFSIVPNTDFDDNNLHDCVKCTREVRARLCCMRTSILLDGEKTDDSSASFHPCHLHHRDYVKLHLLSSCSPIQRHYIQPCRVQKETVDAGVLLTDATVLSSPWSYK